MSQLSMTQLLGIFHLQLWEGDAKPIVQNPPKRTFTPVLLYSPLTIIFCVFHPFSMMIVSIAFFFDDYPFFLIFQLIIHDPKWWLSIEQWWLTMMIIHYPWPLFIIRCSKSNPSRASEGQAPLGPLSGLVDQGTIPVPGRRRTDGYHSHTKLNCGFMCIYIYILHSIYYIILYQIISNLISYYFTFYLHNIYIYTHTNCWFVSFMVCLNMETFSPITPLKWQHDHGLEWATLGCPIGTWTQPKRNASITWF